MCAYRVKSKSFYSNCFFEAVKAKLLHFRYVKISFIPRRLNVDSFPHFYWIDKRSNKICEFSSVDVGKKLGLYPLFFKGNIIESSKERNEIFLNMAIDKEIARIEKKYNFISHITRLRSNNKCDWKFYDKALPIEEFTKGNNHNFVLGCGYKDKKRHVGVYYIDETKGLLNPDNDNIEYFKFYNEELPI